MNNNILVNIIDHYNYNNQKFILKIKNKYNVEYLENITRHLSKYTLSNSIENPTSNINNEYKYMVLDIETDAYFNILQVAYDIYNEKDKLIKEINILINDGIHYTPFYNTITKEEIIKEGITPKEASKIITDDINRTKCIIGHNIIAFDLKRINILNDKFGNKIKNDLEMKDTMLLSKNIVRSLNKNGQIKYSKLGEMADFLLKNTQIDNSKYHDAKYDIMITYECYKILRDKYKL